MNSVPGGQIHPRGRAKISMGTPKESSALYFHSLSEEALCHRDDMEMWEPLD